MTLDNSLIDKRVVQRNIERGKVDAAEYAAMLRALPDLSHAIWRHAETSSSAASGGADPFAAAQPPVAPSDPAASAVRTEPGLGTAPQPWMQG